MKKVGVIFGGVTCEHDVSVVTGLQLIENMDRMKYDIYPIYIHSDGEWYADSRLIDQTIYKDFDKMKSVLTKGYIAPNRKGIVIPPKNFLAKETFIELDVVIPAMHGLNGENGALQGLLDLADIPYTSSGVLGSAVGMDKIMMKKVFDAYAIPILPYTYFLRSEWRKSQNVVIAQVEAVLRYPMFVKPANLGSSIGISKATDRESLIAAIDVAVEYDERVIVENGVEDLKEINCSAIGRGEHVDVSVCEQPVSWKEFLTFDEKYLRNEGGKKGGAKSGDGASGMASMSRKVPADISEEQTAEVKALTEKVFKALSSKGVVRVDFIVDNADGKVYVNEINTIPGSFAFYLWEYGGTTYSQLIDRLIEIAEEDDAEKKANTYTYKSNIIESAGKSLKTGFHK